MSKVSLPLYMEKIKDDSSMGVQDYSNLLALLVFTSVAIYVIYQITFVYLKL